MNRKLGSILIVDDDEDVLLAARLLLKQIATRVDTEPNPQAIPTLLRNERYDVILLDMNFARDVSSGHEGFYWLNRILELDPSAVVVLITAYGDVEMAVRAVKEGATEFVLKPWQNERLISAVTTAVRLRRSKVEAEGLRGRSRTDQEPAFHELIGQSPPMQKVFATVEKVARTDANVLILGENGTGKELVARALHRHSTRADRVFVPVDLGALSETLFESELFGHAKGSFTDAKEDRPGRFESASGGTLFLDEIGNLSLPLQSKLLTVLQRREVIRVGTNQPRPIDIRLISATNKAVYDMVRAGDFRQDLLYRINTVEIHLPPLRERRDDIPLLIEYFLGQYAEKYRKEPLRISQAALRKLERYGWPGNIRELQHAVERAVILSEEPTLQPQDFPLAEPEAGEETGLVFENYNLEEVEKLVIRRALSKHGGNISQAARELGLTRAALYRRLERYGL